VTRARDQISAEDQSIVERLSDEARQAAADAVADGYPPAGAWHRLEARRRDQQPGRRRAWRILLVSCVGAAAMALAIRTLGPLVRPAPPLTFEVANVTLEEGGYVRGDAQRGGQLRFSDGTRIRLGPGAKLSVAAPGARGARLRLQDGEAHFEVMHLPHAAWAVEAGPYVVDVTGTVFDVRWSAADEVAEVHLRSGSVRVSGPLLTEHATLHPGQSLIAHIAARELRIGEDATAGPQNGGEAGHPPQATAKPASEAPEEPARTLTPEPTPVADSEPAAPPRAQKPRRRLALVLQHHEEAPEPPQAWAPEAWVARVTAGDVKAVLDEAEAHGLDSVLAEADAAALVALADAARYDGRTDVATRALLAQRNRFPGTTTASNAAFFLGRLADGAGKTGEALDWYRRYSVEQPRGAYASEALGRAMLAVAHLSSKAAARDMAEEYLDRFPNGTYLLHARQILAAP
jgi:ferric-dicitrate binding protein FerR (iron transport regulator)/TolA-binding protein